MPLETPVPASCGASNTAACLACGGPLRFFGHRKNYRYHCCKTCGSLQLVPQPSSEELSEAYRNQYATAEHITSDGDWCHRISQAHFTAVLRVLQRLSAKKVTEIGAGWGVLCDLLIKNGFDYEGVEPSSLMAQYCRGRGLPVRDGLITDLAPADRDAIVLTNVFEHLVDRDAWLDQAAALLPRGGYLVISQPTATFARLMGSVLRLGSRRLPLPDLHQEFSPPWHTALFSLNGMQTLAKRHGFELVDVQPAPLCRESGLVGLVQASLQMVNNIGWRLLGRKWPLVIVHIFVFRKSLTAVP